MTTPSKPTPNAEIAALLASLNADFGKRKRDAKQPTDADIRKERNKAWHDANQPLSKPGVSQRPRPEDSAAWRPEAKVTNVVIQDCATCGDVVEFINGEYVLYRSIQPFGGQILRRTEYAATTFLTADLERPLEDRIEWHSQTVARCSGCIMVERQAEALLWDQHLEEQRRAASQLKLDINLEQPVTRSLDEAFKEDV